jgi:hypothetical protein
VVEEKPRTYDAETSSIAIIHGSCPMDATFFAGQTPEAVIQYAFPINAVKGGCRWNVRKSNSSAKRTPKVRRRISRISICVSVGFYIVLKY